MLFYYNFVDNHTIYKLQEWMDDLFLNVWCGAEPDVEYNIDLLPIDIKEIVLTLFNNEKPYGDYFYEPIENVYKKFQNLDEDTKQKLATAYVNNNNIEQLCDNDADCQPLLFSDLGHINQELSEVLNDFYKHLFEKVIHLKVVRDKIGEMKHHYDQFVNINTIGKCPFCGIYTIKGKYHSKHEAYDHYLPKDVYPFNSINFQNLSLMCHECNSSYKLRDDPLHERDKVTRRKAFYPYSKNDNPDINIAIKFKKKDLANLTSEDLEIIITSASNEDEVKTWMEVFGIEERYKAMCLEENDGKYWLVQAIEEYNEFSENEKKELTHAVWIQKQINAANNKPYAFGNFIKAAFLEGCRKAKILP